MPWALAKDESKKARLGAVLYNLLEGIRYLAILLKPYMPDTSKEILSQLNTDVTDYDSLLTFGGLKAGESVGEPKVLFSRIDSEKLIAELVAKQEEQQKAEKERIEEIQGIAKIGIDDFAKVEPATLCGVESQGMILAADAGEDDVKVVFLDSSIPNGSKIR